MIDGFIKKLETLLCQYEISEEEKKDIIDDYKQMMADGKEKGLLDDEMIEMVGTPEKIIRELELKRKKRYPNGEKWISLSPFISFIIFMILGLTEGLWHPGWLVFLLVPVTAIVVEMSNDRDKHLLTALSPFIAFTGFFLIGFIYDVWHPTWLIFTLIPMVAIMNSRDEMNCLSFLTALSPFVSFIAFFLIGHYTGAYHLAWLTFLLVILLDLFHEDEITNKILLILSLIVSIGLYLFIYFQYGSWEIGLSAFTIFILTGILTGHVKVELFGTNSIPVKVTSIISIILFIAVGLIFNAWFLSWLFLLLIPVVAILFHQKGKEMYTALSPFIALTLFMLIGHFGDLWHLSWIAFLLIPIVAILENA
ncbi:MAG: HAAS signaling domain-containing protein [Candidatus Woesearchaeota archaeon]